MKKEKNTIDGLNLRRLAEKALENTLEADDDFSNRTPEDMASLIHELRVHQIELKMQNEELRRIQGDLEKTRDRYSHLYDFAPNGYLTVTEKGIIREANLTIASILGETRGLLIGKAFTNFVLKEDQDIFYKHRQRLMETEAPQVCELRLLNKDGHPIFARLECMIAKTSGDDLRDIRASVSDITEQKRAERDLRDSKNRYRGLFNSIRDAILISNTERVIIDCNPAFTDLFGYTIDEIKGKKTCHVYEKEEEFIALGKALQENYGKNPFLAVVNYKKNNGEVFPGETGVYFLKNSDNETVGFIGLIRDITDRKRAEESLQKSETRLRTLVNTIPDLVWLKDLNGVYLSCNPVFERFFGAKESVITGKTDYDFVDKELADSFREHDRRAMAAGGPSINEEWLTFADNGYKGLFETIKSPMYDAHGDLICVLGIAEIFPNEKMPKMHSKKTWNDTKAFNAWATWGIGNMILQPKESGVLIRQNASMVLIPKASISLRMKSKTVSLKEKGSIKHLWT